MHHLERALQDKNEGWRYLVNFLISYLGASILGSIPLLIAIVLGSFKNGTFDPQILTDMGQGNINFTKMGLSLNLGLFLMLLPFVFCFIAFILCMRWFHERNWIEVINGLKKIRWAKFFAGFILWFGLSSLFLIYSYLSSPADFELQLEWSKFIPLLLVALLLLPIQTAYEELLFRGYLAQGFGAWTGSRILAILIPSILFGLMHSFNPEVQEHGFWLTMPQYIGFGIIFGIASTLDDGIETALGAHAANNIFLAIFLTSAESVLQTNAVFKQINVQPKSDMFALFLFGILFLVVLSFFYKWDWRVLGRKITSATPSKYEE